MSSSVFGFPAKTSGGFSGDFAAIIKYDARAGRLFRIDRTQDSAGQYHSEPIDITGLTPGSPRFAAIADFENVETGWMQFAPGQAPSMTLVRFGKMEPPQPSENHKRGIRFMLRLSNECAGTIPVREMAGTAQSFLDGIGAVFRQYLNEKQLGNNQGLLPVITLESTTPITTGSGQRQSTNYQPNFKIIGWQPRGDLAFIPKAPQEAAPLAAQAAPQQAPASQPGFGFNGAAPSTGGARVEPPKQTVSASDFG